MESVVSSLQKERETWLHRVTADNKVEESRQQSGISASETEVAELKLKIREMVMNKTLRLLFPVLFFDFTHINLLFLWK